MTGWLTGLEVSLDRTSSPVMLPPTDTFGPSATASTGERSGLAAPKRARSDHTNVTAAELAGLNRTFLAASQALSRTIHAEHRPGRGRLDWPTLEHSISGWHFHDRRNPSHIGLDISLRTGDPVYAADRGRVEFADWKGGYGKLVVIDHLNGWKTWYGHLSRIDVVVGQRLNAGGVVGLGGSTGWSSGPHLHFEMRLNGIPHNPLDHLP